MFDCDIGLVGLAVMGQNLALNMERNEFSVAVYNRTTAKTNTFVDGPASGKRIVGAQQLEELVGLVRRPRRIVLMVKAGAPIDATIGELAPMLDEGDLIIDGGNSFFGDTERRAKELAAKGLRYIGTGVSGGEEGALHGPSIMPGGEVAAWQLVQPVFERIAANVDGMPCVAHLGPRGAGHYVKMVHNGIEYGDMQLIAEAYDLMRRGLGLEASRLSEIFDEWNGGVLQSFLIEITAEILREADPHASGALVDSILDTAGQKGTGKWTSTSALDLGTPTTVIDAAVASRFLSSRKDERIVASGVIGGAVESRHAPDLVSAVGDALYASKICSYAQGFALLAAASREYDYALDMSTIARIWRGGCIIRARFLNDIAAAFEADRSLENLLVAPFFVEAIAQRQSAWRRVVQLATEVGVPVPAMSAALAYFDGYRSERLPANLIQAQRDYFGAHTYERTDRPRGEFFHTNWGGRGGDVTAGTYDS